MRTATSLVVLLLALGLPAVAGEGAFEPIRSAEPRTLILALDGVPLRVVERAQARGTFADWPEPVGVVSTFPSLTNVAFTAIFEPLGVDPAGGYEVQHFDSERNEVVGGSLIGYEDRLFAWRDAFDLTGRSLGGKLAIYTGPKRSAWKEVYEAEDFLISSPMELVMAHIGATDALLHLRGDESIIEFLGQLDSYLDGLALRHFQARHRPLRVVLLSDHGNGDLKVHKTGGIKRLLRDAGLKVVDKLEGPDDIVAATFGVVGYGALFTRSDRAEIAADALAGHPEVQHVAWRIGEREIGVRSGDDDARIFWKNGADGRRFRYSPLRGDPLGLEIAHIRLRALGEFDANGFAASDAWFRQTANDEIPDPLSRIVDALAGTYVRNEANVIFSLTPGHAWGWWSAHASSALTGGHLEATHGGLDYGSSVGFFLSNDPAFQPDFAMPANRALEGLVGLRKREESGQAVLPTSKGQSKRK